MPKKRQHSNPVDNVVFSAEFRLMFLLRTESYFRVFTLLKLTGNLETKKKKPEKSPLSIETKLKFPAGGANSIKLPLCALPDNKVVVVNLTAGMQFK